MATHAPRRVSATFARPRKTLARNVSLHTPREYGRIFKMLWAKVRLNGERIFLRQQVRLVKGVFR